MDTETIMDQSIPIHSMLLKFDANQQFSKEIQICAYNKLQHHTSNPYSDIPVKKTMYLNRLPPWTNPENLQNLMCRVSGGLTVKAVRIFKNKPLLPLTDENDEDKSLWPQPDRLGRSIRGFKEAHVIFEKTVGVKNVTTELSSNPNKIWLLSTPEYPVVNIGLRKWKHEYNQAVVPNAEAKNRLKDAIEEYIRQHDRLKEEERERAKEMVESQEAGDDEGWVTVSRHTSKKGKPLGNLSVKGQAKIKAKDAKRRHKKELLNFYKFQTREKKLDRLNELKERFEADKIKQAKMKQDRQERKFRPV